MRQHNRGGCSMIYTVTVNPSLDYIIDVTSFRTGIVNRTTGEKINAGGKGINVSIVLHNLGIESVVLGFTAGFTGDKIRTMLAEKGIVSDFIQLQIGKGINVSIVLHNLGIESVVLGFTAGFTGDKIRTMLAEKGIVSDFIQL